MLKRVMPQKSLQQIGFSKNDRNSHVLNQEKTIVIQPTTEIKYSNYYKLLHDSNRACSSSAQNLELKYFSKTSKIIYLH